MHRKLALPLIAAAMALPALPAQAQHYSDRLQYHQQYQQAHGQRGRHDDPRPASRGRVSQGPTFTEFSPRQVPEVRLDRRQSSGQIARDVPVDPMHAGRFSGGADTGRRARGLNDPPGVPVTQPPQRGGGVGFIPAQPTPATKPRPPVSPSMRVVGMNPGAQIAAS